MHKVFGYSPAFAVLGKGVSGVVVLSTILTRTLLEKQMSVFLALSEEFFDMKLPF